MSVDGTGTVYMDRPIPGRNSTGTLEKAAPPVWHAVRLDDCGQGRLPGSHVI